MVLESIKIGYCNLLTLGELGELLRRLVNPQADLGSSSVELWLICNRRSLFLRSGWAAALSIWRWSCLLQPLRNALEFVRPVPKRWLRRFGVHFANVLSNSDARSVKPAPENRCCSPARERETLDLIGIGSH